MNDDSTVTPAPLKKIASILHATWVKGLVQKRPGELFLAVQLQGASLANPNVLQPEVGVRLSAFVSPTREDSSLHLMLHLGAVTIPDPPAATTCDVTRSGTSLTTISAQARPQGG